MHESVGSRVLLPAILISFISIPSVGSVETPATPAGHQLEQLLTAYNVGEMPAWDAFILGNPKAAGDRPFHMARLRSLHSNFMRYGKLEIRRITRSSEYMIEALAGAVNPPGPFGWATVRVEVDSLAPHGWVDFSVRAADDPDEVLPEGDLTEEKLRSYLDPLIDGLVRNDHFSGAILVARDGKPIYKRAEGEACKRYHVANRIDTKFNLGSMNKMFTGVAIVQLAQQGKLSFDDRVGKHLPDYANEAVRDKVTIGHLLTHTAGTGIYWREFLENPRWAFIKSVEDYDALTAEKPLLFEPGERFEYSNCGPIILGLIIERITGMSYDDYIRQNVTGPAGMTDTDCYDMWEPVENVAIGYTRMDFSGRQRETWTNNLFMNPVKGGPAGGGYSTVEDLLRFDVALRTSVLLDAEHVDILTTGKVDRDPDTRYAYLFEEDVKNGHRIVGHSGGAPGINATLRMFMDPGYTVAIMSNYDDGMIYLYRKVEQLLTRD